MFRCRSDSLKSPVQVFRVVVRTKYLFESAGPVDRFFIIVLTLAES